MQWDSGGSVGPDGEWDRAQWDRTVLCSSAGRTSATDVRNAGRAAATVGAEAGGPLSREPVTNVLLLLSDLILPKKLVYCTAKVLQPPRTCRVS